MVCIIVQTVRTGESRVLGYASDVDTALPLAECLQDLLDPECRRKVVSIKVVDTPIEMRR